MRKILFILLGILAIVLGVIGIFVPGLPTTPFILLSSWLFYKSSARMHDWLHASWLGYYIRRYEARKGVSVITKCVSIFCMWAMILISAFFLLESINIRVILLLLGLIGTCCVIFVVPSAKK